MLSIHGDLSSLEILYSGMVYRSETALPEADGAVQSRMLLYLFAALSISRVPSHLISSFLDIRWARDDITWGRKINSPHECHARNAPFSLSIEQINQELRIRKL